METVRAKFECSSVEKSKHWDGTGRFTFKAKLSVVHSGSEENKKFFSSTPGGSIELSAFSDEHFIPGKEYYVDFTPAD